MNLPDLVSFVRSLDLGEPGRERLPPRDSVRAVEGVLRASLGSIDFVLDCLELEVGHVLSGREVRDRTLFSLPERGIQARLVYWSAGLAAGPHEHTSWTVTGVFHNRLEVRTYSVAEAYARRTLVPKHRFCAERGAVGHIYEHCIHNPSNPTGHGTVSIHVFNENDQPRIERDVGPIPGLGLVAPRDRAGGEPSLDAWQAHMRRFLLAILSRWPSRRARDLIERIYVSGDLVGRVAAARALLAFDGADGERRLREAVAEAGAELR